MFIKKKKLEKLSAVLIECMIERLAVDTALKWFETPLVS